MTTHHPFRSARAAARAGLCLLLALSGGVPEVFGAAATPERFPETRYAKLRAESPFAVATAQEVKEEKIPWAQNLYIGSVAKMKQDGDEKDWVIIKDRTQPGTLIQLFGTDPNAEGYQLVKLEWAEDPKKTKASVKKGTEFATIEMDQMAFTAPAPMPQGMPKPVTQPGAVPAPGVNPAVRPQVPAGYRPSPVATPMRIATPAARPPVQIPRPANLPPALPQTNPIQPGAAQPNANTRQRIRVIPSNP